MTVFRFVRLSILAVATLAVAAGIASAQDSDVKKYNVDVKLEPSAHAADVRTTFTLWNPTDAPKRRLQFRIIGKAEVRSVTAGAQSATFDANDDRRYTGLKVVTVQLPSPVPGRGTMDITVVSRLTLTDATPDATITPGSSVLLPTSLWFPIVNTPYIQYGANTAPFTLTATTAPGEKVLSGGALEGNAFVQPLYGLPFLISGSFDAPIAKQASEITFEAWLASGAEPEARAGADRILADAEKIAAFYTRVLGPAPASTTFRIIATDSGAGYSSPSGVTLGRRVFRRERTDAETFELLADAIARVWTEGPFAVRGAAPGPSADRSSGVGLLHDALPRYLALLAIGDRFGKDAEAAAFDRLRVGLYQMGDVAAQVQLALATPYDSSYTGLMVTKGALVFRIFERDMGREQVLAAVRSALATARTNGYLTFEDLRGAMEKAAGHDLRPLITTWVETVVQPDIIVGIPQQSGGAWTSALRNLGTGDVAVDVVATTESGKKLTVRATVPSKDFGQARFETTEKIARVEVDPEHIIPQTDYSNDARPQTEPATQLFVEAVGAVQRKEFGPAEEKLRQAVAAAPGNASFMAWEARALLGLGRQADAIKLANGALAVDPLPLDAGAWGNNVLGQIALASGNAKEALDRFNRAATYAVETSALRTANDGLIEANKATGQPAQVDPSVAKFFAGFDAAVSAGISTVQAETYVDSTTLPQFVKGLVAGLQRKWTTEVLRSELLGTNEAVVDTRFVVQSSQKTDVARTITRLRRSGESWRIVDVQILDTTDTDQGGASQ